MGVWVSTTNSEPLAKVDSLGAQHGGALPYVEFQPSTFGRLLAAIAHGFAVYSRGHSGFIPLLPDIILGRGEDVFRFVGGTNGPSPFPRIMPIPSIKSLHQTIIDTTSIDGRLICYAEIRLFSHLNPWPPCYCVVIGEVC
jgi:hypothetical protein